MRILVCGLPFSGKTEVLKILKRMNNCVFISDDFVKSVYKPNKEGYLLIKQCFGSSFVTRQGVDRIKLRSYIYENKNALIKLNSLIQPLIVRAIKSHPKRDGLLFVESKVAIDYDSYYKNLFHLAWLVIAKSTVMNKRVALNNNNMFIKREMSDDFYNKKALNLYKCIVIKNNNSKKDLEKLVLTCLIKTKDLK